jgi:hypothetical protein
MHYMLRKFQQEYVMKKLTETMKQMLDALACAHAGEYLSQREKAKFLAAKSDAVRTEADVAEPVAGCAEPARIGALSNARRIALYLGSELSPEVMGYVIETCSRMRHELTVLTFQSEISARALLDPYRQALEAAGVDMRVEGLTGEPLTGLRRYLRSHPEVAFLACKDAGYLGRSYLYGSQSQKKNSLPVPVVVITTANKAGGVQEQPASERSGSGAEVA